MLHPVPLAVTVAALPELRLRHGAGPVPRVQPAPELHDPVRLHAVDGFLVSEADSYERMGELVDLIETRNVVVIHRSL